MYPLLLLAVVSLPFIDLEVLRVGATSIVLPYVTTLLLAVPLIARPSRLTPILRDATIPFLLAWLAIAIASTALGVSTYFEEPYLRYERETFFSHNVTQVMNVALMVAQYVVLICALRAISFAQLGRLIALFIAVGAVGAVYSLYQIGSVLYGWPFRDVFRTSTLYLKAPTLDLGGFGGWIRFPRAFGLAPEPSMWGAYLVIVLGFVLGRLARRISGRDLLALLLLAAATLVTFSRSAWLAVVVLLALWSLIIWTTRIPRTAMWAMVLAIVVWTVLPAAAITDRMTPVFGDLSALERISAQMTGLNVFRAHPLFGVGFGSFPFLIHQYLFQIAGYDRVNFFTVFNFYLLVLLSTGVIGAAVFLAYVASVLRRVDAAFRVQTADRRAVEVRAGSALAAAAVLMLWLNMPAYNVTYVWFCLAVAAVLPFHLAQAREPLAARR